MAQTCRFVSRESAQCRKKLRAADGEKDCPAASRAYIRRFLSSDLAGIGRLVGGVSQPRFDAHSIFLV
jgi:hypothetical protein